MHLSQSFFNDTKTVILHSVTQARNPENWKNTLLGKNSKIPHRVHLFKCISKPYTISLRKNTMKTMSYVYMCTLIFVLTIWSRWDFWQRIIMKLSTANPVCVAVLCSADTENTDSCTFQYYLRHFTIKHSALKYKLAKLDRIELISNSIGW